MSTQRPPSTTQPRLDSPNRKSGEYASLLAAAEVGLGSLLHNLHLPFSGHFLSLNQIFILSLACEKDKASAASISTTAAVLKLLYAPGKKITPMLAIAAQGYLFALGARLSLYLGAGLASQWAFIQAFFVFTLISAGSMFDIYSFYTKYFKDLKYFSHLFSSISYALLFALVLKTILALIMVLIAKKIPLTKLQSYKLWLSKAYPESTGLQEKFPTFVEVFRDILKPFYLLSLTIILFYHYQTSSSFAHFRQAFLLTLASTILVIFSGRVLGYVSLKYLPKKPPSLL